MGARNLIMREGKNEMGTKAAEDLGFQENQSMRSSRRLTSQCSSRHLMKASATARKTQNEDTQKPTNDNKIEVNGDFYRSLVQISSTFLTSR